MKSGNVVQDKSYKFALKVISTCRILSEEKKEFVLSRQLLKSGTSIGANVEEAIGGQSKKDFVAKLSIAYKEARETKYWLRLLRDSNLMTKEDAYSMLVEVEELLRIIGSIIKTSRKSV